MPRSLRAYTARNIRNEIVHRVAAWRARSRDVAVPDDRLVDDRDPYDERHAQSVASFYDTHHESFMRVYGNVIQAFRTRDIADLLNHQLRALGLQAGQRVLDAGCGVAAAAIHFAQNAGVHVDAITISRVQFEAARRNVAVARLHDHVNVVLGDYHRLPDYFASNAYDAICFLESFGHSRDKARVLDACWRVLKPGGVVYIKDLFVRVPVHPEHAAAIAREVRKINDAYRYEIGSLNVLLDDVRRRGFHLTSVRSVDLDPQAFEDLAISNEFQDLTGIARIEDWSTYVFPVDFFEVTCRKPPFALEARLDRHYLQNLAHST